MTTGAHAAAAVPVTAEVSRVRDIDDVPDQLEEIKTLLTGLTDAAGAKALAGAAVSLGNQTSNDVAVLKHQQAVLDVKIVNWETALNSLSEKIGTLIEQGKLVRFLRIVAYLALTALGCTGTAVAYQLLLDGWQWHGGGR